MKLTIAPEREHELPAIHGVVAAAFATTAEARLVDALREQGALVLSLVAAIADEPVGHVAFSPVTVTREDGRGFAGVGLAPLAVLPEYQRCGIGSRLTEAALDELRTRGHAFCIVLGHPEYYPRFGFVPASRFGIRWEHEVRDEAFMVLELRPGALAGVSGVARYHAAFGELAE
jgi:putative acetyltransferase